MPHMGSYGGRKPSTKQKAAAKASHKKPAAKRSKRAPKK